MKWSETEKLFDFAFGKDITIEVKKKLRGATVVPLQGGDEDIPVEDIILAIRELVGDTVGDYGWD